MAVFYGREYLDTVRLLCKEHTTQKRPYFFSIDGRNPKKKCVTVRDVGLLYGHRPKYASVLALSPYEFMMQWEPVMASYPRTALEDQKLQHHASLTVEGVALANSKSIPVDEKRFEAGIHYIIRESADGGWLTYPETCPDLRHGWILRRRHRPVVPAFVGCPVPRKGALEDNARI